MQASTRVVLQPIAAPSILGLFGFAAATFMVATNLAGWYGSAMSPIYLFPFAAIFGGVAQFSAGMWTYRARAALATAMHGMWGSFWASYGILWLLVAVHALTLPAGKFPELAFCFFPLAAINGLRGDRLNWSESRPDCHLEQSRGRRWIAGDRLPGRW